MVSTSSSVCLDRPTPHMRPLARTRHRNACAALALRWRGITSNDFGTLLGSNLRILKSIILQEGTGFAKVWMKSSKSLISYESGRIYFENYRCCYSSLTPQPQLLYELPKQSKAEKIEDSLLCQCPLDHVLPQASEQKPSLLALTANNWLYCLSADNGETLHKVYLSSRFKFRSLGWDISQETFYVKSIQHKQTVQARQAGVENNILMHLAIFKVFPLDVVGMLEINKKVFGKSTVDVLLSQGVLAVSHSSKCVKLYSFEYIVEKVWYSMPKCNGHVMDMNVGICVILLACGHLPSQPVAILAAIFLFQFRTRELVLGEQCDLYGPRGTVGEAPYGIPVNIQIKECPPVLFEVSYFDNGIQIGGHPWHYIHTPNHKRHRGTHHICSIRDGTLAKNGVQEMDCDSLEADWIFFHPDDSGRIIHAGPSTIKVLNIKTEAGIDAHYEVVPDFSISATRDNSLYSQVTVTSSGRTVKRRFQQLDDDPGQETFKMVKYEDELDLLAIVDVSHTEDEGQANVRLHDNKNGALMKRISLKEPWDVTYCHEVHFDRDTVIHIEQQRNNNFCCHVYKINRRKNV
ncbi:DDB1- and CUL4-associated factor 17 isoform X1 [Electrophorus electricus]|uniref:DDB1- and CUL4-associated factor 17 isoform X1 n=2 Tax=Electrophorus electricus TaxID=8005 RepID=UPI0015CFAA3A|nr:DDB1- and CUL4-associated factor 17 isoform X1 [Electrophorus electricus]